MKKTYPVRGWATRPGAHTGPAPRRLAACIIKNIPNCEWSVRQTTRRAGFVACPPGAVRSAVDGASRPTCPTNEGARAPQQTHAPLRPSSHAMPHSPGVHTCPGHRGGGRVRSPARTGELTASPGAATHVRPRRVARACAYAPWARCQSAAAAARAYLAALAKAVIFFIF